MNPQKVWTYDSNRGLHFFLDRNGQRVYENDARLADQRRQAVRSFPRSMPQQPQGAISQANPLYFSATGAGTYTATPQQQHWQHVQTTSTQPAIRQGRAQGSQHRVAQNPSGGLIGGFQHLTLSNSTPFHQQQNQAHRQQPPDSPLLRNEFRKRKNPADFFKKGKVFMLLWNEGTQVDRESVMSGKAWSRNSYDEWVYSKVRRFIVVSPGKRSCVAVPITTNSGQGAAKEGEQKSDYCIVHSGKDIPPLGPGEQPSYAGEATMQPQPIRVDIDTGEKLDPMSRINLAGPQTIQHHQKVKSIGKVHPKSMYSLEYQFKLVIGGVEPTPATRTQDRSVLPSEAERLYKAVIAQGYTPQQAIAILSQRQDDSQQRQRRGSRPDVACEDKGDDEEDDDNDNSSDSTEAESNT